MLPPLPELPSAAVVSMYAIPPFPPRNRIVSPANVIEPAFPAADVLLKTSPPLTVSSGAEVRMLPALPLPKAQVNTDAAPYQSVPLTDSRSVAAMSMSPLPPLAPL